MGVTTQARTQVGGEQLPSAQPCQLLLSGHVFHADTPPVPATARGVVLPSPGWGRSRNSDSWTPGCSLLPGGPWASVPCPVSHEHFEDQEEAERAGQRQCRRRSGSPAADA